MKKVEEKIKLRLADGKSENELTFTELYKCCFPKTKAYILKNSGNIDDAKDVFQETMIVLIEKTKAADFTLTSSLSTFLYGVSRNIWLNKLKEKGKITTCENFEDIPDIKEDKSELLERKLTGWLSQITFRCQQIIKSLFFLSEPMSNLAYRMGWKNKHTADNQKYKCIQQLKKVSEI